MEKQFCTHKIALKLKELGFKEDCLGYYICRNSAFGIDDLLITTEYVDLLPYDSSSCKAPLWSQAIDWLETKGYYINITRVFSWNTTPPEFKGWCVYIGTNNAEEMLDCNEFFIENFYPTKYEAREQAILKAIELCQK